MIHAERMSVMNDAPVRKGRYVLYWMQQSQRAVYNHALEHAIGEGNRLDLPVVVVFGITDHFPGANLRHYTFMLEGLQDTSVTLAARGIQLVVRHQSPHAAALELAGNAALLVADRGYLRIQKKWRRCVAAGVSCSMVQVESDVIVPVEIASDKEEFAARTIRPKIHRHLERYLVPLRHTTPRHSSLKFRFKRLSLDDVDAVLGRLDVDRGVRPVTTFHGGTRAAEARLRRFITHRLGHYAAHASDPARDCVSNMSPYLHFGQVSPLYVVLRMLKVAGNRDSVDAYLEQLVVRRELSMNFAHFNPRYDSFASIPEWARRTLQKHRHDRRKYVYTRRELEQARTHDAYWNAAQLEMAHTGKMHNYMRMYWAKNILQWSETPEKAFRTALHLNNRYELDGRDPNGFAGVAWCFGKHDRPWGESPVFGTVRRMTTGGLERKFNMANYLEKVRTMEGSDETSGT